MRGFRRWSWSSDAQLGTLWKSTLGCVQMVSHSLTQPFTSRFPVFWRKKGLQLQSSSGLINLERRVGTWGCCFEPSGRLANRMVWHWHCLTFQNWPRCSQLVVLLNHCFPLGSQTRGLSLILSWTVCPLSRLESSLEGCHTRWTALGWPAKFSWSECVSHP